MQPPPPPLVSSTGELAAAAVGVSLVSGHSNQKSLPRFSTLNTNPLEQGVMQIGEVPFPFSPRLLPWILLLLIAFPPIRISCDELAGRAPSEFLTGFSPLFLGLSGCRSLTSPPIIRAVAQLVCPLGSSSFLLVSRSRDPLVPSLAL